MKKPNCFMKFLALVHILVAGLALSVQTALANHHSQGTITDIVAKSGGEFDKNHNDFDILLNAVLAAGLDGALADPKANLTVFAPTDQAFIRFARDLGHKVYREQDAFKAIVETLTVLGIPVLTNVLLYHVSPQAKSLLRVLYSNEIKTLLGDSTIVPVRLRLLDNDPDFKNPRLLLRAGNIKAKNGVIHAINRVLIPADLPSNTPVTKSIVEIVSASGGKFDHNWNDYDILLNAVLAAGLQNALADPAADLTVFAPKDIAFIRLARSLGYRGFDESGAYNFIVASLTSLGGGDPIPLLSDILLYHVSPSAKTLKDVVSSDRIDTLLTDAGFKVAGRVLIDNDPGLRNPRINLYVSDVRALNGFVHTINRVLIPVNVTGK